MNNLKKVTEYSTNQNCARGWVSQASKAYGGVSKVMDAIEKHGGLKAVEAETNELASKKTGIEREIEELEKTVGSLEGQMESVKSDLNLYNDLKERGFNRKALEELKKASENFNVSEVLSAINAYKDLESIKAKISELKGKKTDLETELKKIVAEHAHLQPVINMSETLLNKYGFSIQAIGQILATAKKYGEPFAVLEATGKYGDVKALDKEINRLSTEKGKLEGKLNELSAQVEKLKGVAEEIRTNTTAVLEPISKEVQTAFDSITKHCNKSIARAIFSACFGLIFVFWAVESCICYERIK